MKRYTTNDPKIHWEDTGKVNIYNYPPEGRTFSYAIRIYRQYEKGKFGHTIIEGEPIYFHEMTYEQQSLFVIMATAQNVLCGSLKREKFLKEVKI